MRQDIIAGDTLSFLTSLPAFPPTAGWALKFRLTPSKTTGTPIELAAVAEGSAYRTQASAVTTAGWPADAYTWTSWVERSTESYSIESGKVFIRPNPRTLPAGFDGRSQAEVILAAINTEIAARLSGGASVEYTIGTRSLKREPLAALMTLRGQYRLIVARERRAQLGTGQGDPSRVAVRFRP